MVWKRKHYFPTEITEYVEVFENQRNSSKQLYEETAIFCIKWKMIHTYLKNLNLPQTPAELLICAQIELCHKPHFKNLKFLKDFASFIK